MEDLLQFVFIALFVLFGLLGGRKKRQQRTGSTGPTRSTQRPERPKRQAPPRRRVDEMAPPIPHRMGGDMIDEIFEALGGTPAETVEAESSEEFENIVEAQSLETLVAAGGESHKKFHALYMETPPLDVERKPREHPRKRLGLSGKRLKDAIVLTEVLGAPIALRGPEDAGPWREPVA